jgi:hypothetical protein
MFGCATASTQNEAAMDAADITFPAVMRAQLLSDSEERTETEASPVLALLEALRRLSFRGDGPDAWAAPLSQNPLAFLLDAVNEVVNVWTASGELVFSNRFTSPAGSVSERRCLPFTLMSARYVLEVIRESPTGPARSEPDASEPVD